MDDQTELHAHGITFNLTDILDCIFEQQMSDYITTKSRILEYLQIEDNKENRKLLTKAIKILKERGQIWTSYAVYESGGYGGRGYIMIDSLMDEARKRVRGINKLEESNGKR